ncbi:hypothetical protein ACS0TY_006068 [Phlomoides rotata]
MPHAPPFSLSRVVRNFESLFSLKLIDSSVADQRLTRLIFSLSRQAWQKLGAMPPEEAMEKYIDIVSELYPTWLAGSSIIDESSGDAFSEGSKGPMGPVFSSFVHDEEPGSGLLSLWTRFPTFSLFCSYAGIFTASFLSKCIQALCDVCDVWMCEQTSSEVIASQIQSA